MAVDIDIKNFEQMAKLDLACGDREEIKKYMDFLISAFEKNTAGYLNLEPLIHGIELKNVFREDKAVKKISRDELLGNAPEHSGGYFRTPKTID